MAERASGKSTDDGTYIVDPVELFFDLVYVFGVSQLSVHLHAHLSWRGGGETLVLLVGVFAAWYFASWQGTILDVRRRPAFALLLGMMLLGLFLNASVTHAFEGSGWDFVLPYLLIQLGGTLWARWHAASAMWKDHFQRTLWWLAASTPLWVLGAAGDTPERLGWWASAVVIDLVGTWSAHPTPRRRLHSEGTGVAEATHMLERCRLFLIVALGETVLTTGTAITSAHWSTLTVVAGAAALLSTIALWFILFGPAGELVLRYVESGTSDPTHAARLAGNVLTMMLAGLIALAVGNEIAVGHPDADVSAALPLLLFGGPGAVLVAQVWFLHTVPETRNGRRLLGLGVVALTGLAAAMWEPSPLTNLLLAACALTASALLAHLQGGEREVPGDVPASADGACGTAAGQEPRQ